MCFPAFRLSAFPARSLRVLIAAAALASPAIVTADDLLFVRLTDHLCVFDGHTKYRIVYHAHTMRFNQSTQSWFIATGYPDDIDGVSCPGEFGQTPNSLTVTYAAEVLTDPCTNVASVQFTATGTNTLDYICGVFVANVFKQIGPQAIVDVPGEGIAVSVGPATIDPQDPPCAIPQYTVTWANAYDYSVHAIMVDANGGCAGGVPVLVEQGTLLGTKITGRNCDECGQQMPDNGGGNGGDDPLPGPGPDPDNNPGGPGNPNGAVCCELLDGSFVETTYAACLGVEGIPTAYPCGGGEPPVDPIVCCTFNDGSGTVEATMLESECVALSGTFVEGPCDVEPPEGCLDCCLAILDVVTQFSNDIRAPLRNFLLEDFPAHTAGLFARLDVITSLLQGDDDDGPDINTDIDLEDGLPDPASTSFVSDLMGPASNLVPEIDLGLDETPWAYEISFPNPFGGDAVVIDFSFGDNPVINEVRYYSDPLLMFSTFIGCTLLVSRTLRRH